MSLCSGCHSQYSPPITDRNCSQVSVNSSHECPAADKVTLIASEKYYLSAINEYLVDFQVLSLSPSSLSPLFSSLSLSLLQLEGAPATYRDAQCMDANLSLFELSSLIKPPVGDDT